MTLVTSPCHIESSSSLDDFNDADDPALESPCVGKKFRRRKIVFAFRAALTGSIGGLLLGYDLGVMSGALPIITREFGLSVYQQELVTSLMLFGCVIGACGGGIVCDRIGRKRTVYIVCLIFLLGSIIMSTSHTLPMLYIGRVIIGFGVSVSAIVDISYLSEISPPEYRGAVVGTNEFMITVGILLAFFIDFIFMNISGGWRYMFAFPIILVSIWSILMAFMPESPRWLLVKGHTDEAMQVYLITCGRSESDALREYKHADASIQTSRASDSFGLHNCGGKRWQLSMVVSIALMLLQQLSGHAPVITYAPELFAKAGLATETGGVATIVLGVIKVAFTLVSLSIVDLVGRRSLLLCGAAGMAFSLLALSAAFDRSNGAPEEAMSSTQTVAALVSVCFTVAFYSLGFGPVTWLVVSELFPDEYRGRAIAIATVANWTANAVIIASYLSVVETFGERNTFVMYAVVCFLSVYFIYAYVPETHRKEIPQVLRDLDQRFQHNAAMECICPSRGRGDRCFRWGHPHDRVPLAVHLDFRNPSSTLSSGKKVLGTGHSSCMVPESESPPSEQDGETEMERGTETRGGMLNSMSEDSADSSKAHHFSVVQL